MQKTVLVNIPSTIEDPSYRYKMPRLILKIEGKGNGIKTNLVNLHEVAKALRCPDEYPLKYLGFELGSQIQYKKTNENDITCIISGAFQDEPIRKLLDKFIEKYIICPKCKYPEMLIKVRKEKFGGTCECCGTKSALDNTHRLAGFILKNPPAPIQSLRQEKGNETEDQFAGKKLRTKRPTADRLQLQLGSEKLNEMLGLLTETYQRQENVTEQEDMQLVAHQITADIKSFNIENGLYDRVCYLIFQSMFDLTNIQQIERNNLLLSHLIKCVEPKYPQVELILNIEYLISKNNIEEKYIPTILKHFYDYELLDEEFLVNWGGNLDWCTKDYLENHFLWNSDRDELFRKQSQQIIDWLRSSNDAAEEEVDEEEVQNKQVLEQEKFEVRKEQVENDDIQEAQINQ